MSKKKPQLLAFFQRFFLNANVLVFFVCLLLSALFWTISAFNRTSSFTFSIPVNFVNLPKEKILKEELPHTISLEIKGSGIKLFILSLRKPFEEINIDFTSLKKTGENVYAFSATSLNSISKNLNSGIEVLRVKPEFIFINENKASIKRVRVVPDVMMDFETSGESYATINSKPDYITISGDSSILNEIDSILTEKVILNSLDQDINQKVQLVFPENLSDRIFSSTNEVEISINKDKYTDAELEIPIEIDNLPIGYSIQLFPKKVKVKFQVGVKYFSFVKSEDFRACIDYGKSIPGKNYLPIQLNKIPKHLRNIRLIPEKTEYLLKK